MLQGFASLQLKGGAPRSGAPPFYYPTSTISVSLQYGKNHGHRLR